MQHAELDAKNLAGDRAVLIQQRDQTYQELLDLANRHAIQGAALEQAEDDARSKATWALILAGVGVGFAAVAVEMAVSGDVRGAAVTGGLGGLGLIAGIAVARW